MTFNGSAARPGRARKQPPLVDFVPHETTVTLATGSHKVIVAADALLFWWGADSGPQTAEGLVAQHFAEIEAAVMAKLAANDRDSDGSSIAGMPILVGEDDLP